MRGRAGGNPSVDGQAAALGGEGGEERSVLIDAEADGSKRTPACSRRGPGRAACRRRRWCWRGCRRGVRPGRRRPGRRGAAPGPLPWSRRAWMPRTKPIASARVRGPRVSMRGAKAEMSSSKKMMMKQVPSGRAESVRISSSLAAASFVGSDLVLALTSEAPRPASAAPVLLMPTSWPAKPAETPSIEPDRSRTNTTSLRAGERDPEEPRSGRSTSCPNRGARGAAAPSGARGAHRTRDAADAGSARDAREPDGEAERPGGRTIGAGSAGLAVAMNEPRAESIGDWQPAASAARTREQSHGDRALQPPYPQRSAGLGAPGRDLVKACSRGGTGRTHPAAPGTGRTPGCTSSEHQPERGARCPILTRAASVGLGD